MNPILATALVAAFVVLGDFFIKLASEAPAYTGWRWLLIGALIYFVSALGWFYAMKQMKLGTLGAVYSLTTVLLLVMVGTLFFNERLNYYEMGGIALAVVSILLLSRFA